jgi:exodeoxyribonuclease VII small subunit|uniref:exodeoxyribonuclease VII small subunit n=1 Tax=Zobellella denitrificans TaxID=347534 RepID=UPI0034A0C827
MLLLPTILQVEPQGIAVATKKPENMDFESALAELESLVSQLEEGELSLEQALKSFERGVQLVRAGQQRLAQAEQQVQVLLQQEGEERLVAFNPGQEER